MSKGIYDLEVAAEIRDLIGDLFNSDGTIRDKPIERNKPINEDVSFSRSTIGYKDDYDKWVGDPIKKTKTNTRKPIGYSGGWLVQNYEDLAGQEVSDIMSEEGLIACHDVAIAEIAEKVCSLLNEGRGFTDPFILELLAIDNEYTRHKHDAVVNTLKMNNRIDEAKGQHYQRTHNECKRLALKVKEKAIEMCRTR